MKNKSAVLFVLGFVALLAGAANAAPGVRGAKPFVSTFGTTSAVMVSSGPTTVYSVVLGTGAATDFAVLYDSGSTNGITAAGLLQSSGGFKLRLYSTSTANGNVVFDPPLIFRNGVVLGNATAVMTSIVTYEKGVASSGY